MIETQVTNVDWKLRELYNLINKGPSETISSFIYLLLLMLLYFFYVLFVFAIFHLF